MIATDLVKVKAKLKLIAVIRRYNMVKRMTEKEWKEWDERMRKLLQEKDWWCCGTPDEYERLRQQKMTSSPSAPVPEEAPKEK